MTRIDTTKYSFTVTQYILYMHMENSMIGKYIGR